MSKVVIMESLGISDAELKRHEQPFIEKGHEFVSYEKTGDTETLVTEAKDADVMILANMPMPAEVLEKAENLKFIDVAFTGTDHVALSVARERGIKVSNASGYSNEAVAELVLGMVLNLLRNMSKVEMRCRAGETKAGLVGSELKGKTVGIIGYGKIGRRSAELFHAFGCRVLAQSRTVKPDAQGFVTQVDQDTLLKESDIVVLHCPLNDSTRGMINKEKLSLMKPTALLINVARGPVVVSQDLADALNNGVIAGAGVDVFDKEPPLPLDEPLLHAKNCLVTPHVAFASEESMSLRADIVFENLKAFFDGGQLNPVL